MNQVLMEKWDEMLNSDKVESITDVYKRKVTAQLLENEEKFLAETASSVASNVDTWDPVLISLVRRMAPKLIAYDVCGVQPMTMPTGLVFAMRSRYTDKNGAEAFVNEADTDFSGTGTHLGSDPWGSYTTGTGKALVDGEADVWASMSMTIEKTSVTAKTRQLRADYSIELAQDLRAVHGLDAENELSNILSTEIVSEINREVVRKIYSIAKVGAQFATAPGTFDLSSDADGRWSVERYKGLMYAIERDANVVAYETRRGKANYIITSADVASALVMAGLLDYTPNLQANVALEVDVTGVVFAGNMGRYKVYVDPYLSSDGYVVGYKGANAYDAGMFYCPYVPLQMVKAVDPVLFQPAIGFKTRYGIVANPFTSLSANANVYYRKVAVTNLM
jgi:hypothetical protein